MGNYFLSPEALEDIDSIWLHIAKDNPGAADRVVESAYRSCVNLAAHPQLGPIRRFPNNDPLDIRFLVMADFPNYIIFYRVVLEGIEVVRVLHGAQDIDNLFGQS